MVEIGQEGNLTLDSKVSTEEVLHCWPEWSVK